MGEELPASQALNVKNSEFMSRLRHNSTLHLPICQELWLVPGKVGYSGGSGFVPGAGLVSQGYPRNP